MKHHALLPAATLLLAACPPAATIAAHPQETAPATRFTRDPARFEAKKEQIAAVYEQASPEAGVQVRQFLAQDLLAIVAEPLARMGLDTTDVADMVTLYWIAAHDAANGVVGQETDPAIARAARQQIGGMTAAMPQLAQMSGAEKQDMADTMLLQGLLIEGRMQSAQAAGPQMLQQMSDQIHREASELTKTD